jgi:hypothetical protein
VLVSFVVEGHLLDRLLLSLLEVQTLRLGELEEDNPEAAEWP